MSHVRAHVQNVIGDQRGTPRFVLLIRAAKLVTSGGEYLCIVRDVSETGLKVRTFCPLPRDAQMVLELPNGDTYSVRKIWENCDNAGFRFTGDVDLVTLLGDNTDRKKRPVRLKLALPATLHTLHGARDVLFRDISQQGGCIECFTRLAVDEQVRLESPQLPPIICKVRWRREHLYGLVFDQTFQFDQLARLMASAQQRLGSSLIDRARR